MMNMKKIFTLYLLFIFISFVGFLYETLLAYIMQFEDLDRGFLSLPLCPIYGSGVILTYLLFNVPSDMRIFKYHLRYNNKVKIYLYFLLSATLATLLEFIVGFFCEKAFGKILWEYNDLAMSFNKYCSLLPSIVWGLAITIFMNSLFGKLYFKFEKIKLKNMIIFSVISIILIAIDIINIILKT